MALTFGEFDADGKRHYGDGLYKEAEGILGYSQGALRNFKSLSEQIEMSWRHDKLSWQHHYEVASIKQVEEGMKGKLKLSDKPGKRCLTASGCPG